jgi:hypothetical protein
MDDFLRFRRMITPAIIQIVFWIGVVFCAIMGIGGIVQGGMQSVVGLLTLVLGPFVVRIYCELVILFFRINETLTDIKNNTGRPLP